jgi:hypothetical protein
MKEEGKARAGCAQVQPAFSLMVQGNQLSTIWPVKKRRFQQGLSKSA